MDSPLSLLTVVLSPSSFNSLFEFPQDEAVAHWFQSARPRDDALWPAMALGPSSGVPERPSALLEPTPPLSEPPGARPLSEPTRQALQPSPPATEAPGHRRPSPPAEMPHIPHPPTKPKPRPKRARSRSKVQLQVTGVSCGSSAPEQCRTVSYKQLPEVQQVRHGLFIGTNRAATQKQLVDALEITHVVSMSGSPPSWPEDIEYHVQCIPHEDDCLFLKCLSSACDFVRQALALGGNVLVHCVRGVNLSAATVVGYLMLDEQLSFEQAVEAVQQIRPCINLRLGLQDQLRQWEDSLGLSRYSKRPLKNRQPLKGDFCEIQIQLPRLRRT